MLHKIISFSLHQRFIVLLAVCILAAIGVVGVRSLTLDAVPDITTNQVIVNTNAPGMAAAEVEKLVTFPVEASVAGATGVESVRSLSTYGLSQVVITFADKSDVYFDRQIVNERLAAVREQLPASVEAPELGPVATGLGDIYMYAVESDTRSAKDLKTAQDWTIKPQLRTIPGIAEVNTTGGEEKQFEAKLDADRMRSRGVSIRQVIEAIEKNNSNAGGGYIERYGQQLIIRSVGLAASLADIGNIVVDAESGVPIYVKDIATLGFGSPLRTGVATKDGREAVIGTVIMLKGGNGRTVAQAVDRKIDQIRQQLPADIKLTTVYNRSDLVDHTVGTVTKSLLEGGLLIIGVLLLLLGNLRAAAIVAVLIPLSMLLAATCMNRYGISGNLMSLGAIDFGLIVDGGVFMVENIVRRLAHERARLGRTLTRQQVRHSVLASSIEVASPVTFSVLIITVVYLPILALEGTEGKMFQPMAYTVVFALLAALALTLTLIPVLCSLFLSGDTRERRNPVMDTVGRLFATTLDFAFRQRIAVAIGAVALLVASGLLATKLGSEFIPQLDEGSLVMQPVRLRTVGSEETVKLVTAAENVVRETPEVTTVFSKSGTAEVATDPMPMSLTDSFIMLKPRSEWRAGMTKDKLIEEIQRNVEAKVPGQGYGFSQPIQLRFAELIAGVKADVGVKVFGEDLDVLRKKADEIAKVAASIPGAQDISVEQVDDVPVMEIRISRSAIARAGVNVDDVQEWVNTALAGRSLGQIVEADRRFAVVVRLPEEVRSNADRLRALPVATPNGGSVSLGSLAEIVTVPAPAQVSRENGKRRIVVQFNVRGVDLGTFVPEVQSAIKARVSMPEGYYVEYGGQYENLQRAQSKLAVVVPMALGLIFVLLFFSFGSVRQCLLVLTCVPFAVTGGVVALWLAHLPLSITAGVGFIALSGVAVLNGVVMVSAINALRKEGVPLQDAVRQGAEMRLRPILMTALVAALGFMPMALNTGVGSEVQRPLATVVIGGIASATLLSLVVLPVLYRWFEKDEPLDDEDFGGGADQEVEGLQGEAVTA
ncbi:MAG TPA: CusA/CzcA family heavy metal efflux RND transporter [Capsulimonadaceae bacterium]|jgi:cobalt-zinc-cadmium resistance protein CzcA